MKWLIMSLFAIVSFSAHADRVAEVEDYYTERTSKFIQSRFPSQAFTVIVLVEAQRSQNKKEKAENLPYFDAVEKEHDVWNKAEVPLSTLISFVDKVSIKVELESAMEEKEVQILQAQLFDYLKLSTASDKIEIIKIPLRPSNQVKQEAPAPTNWWLWAGFAIALMSLFFAFMQWSVRSLIKGLSQPLADLNKSSQTLATHGFNSRESSPTTSSWSGTQNSSDSSYESRKMFKELFTETKILFENPTLELMEFLEEEGQRNPAAMSVVFAELDKESLKDLYAYGTGDWWYYALATPPQVSPAAIDVIFKIHKLKIKNELSTSVPMDADLKDFSIVLNRLNDEELAQVLKPSGYMPSSFVLQLLAKNKAMRICKNIYPGNWAQFVDPLSPKGKMNSQQMKELKKEALKVRPLREMKAVDAFFSEIEIEKYLDMASTWDEREYYKVLKEDSRTKKSRVPFFNLFEISKEAFGEILQEISLDEIALIYGDCEIKECARFYEQLTERQRFRLKEILNQKEKVPFADEAKRGVKNKVRLLLEQQQKANVVAQTEIQEAA